MSAKKLKKILVIDDGPAFESICRRFWKLTVLMWKRSVPKEGIEKSPLEKGGFHYSRRADAGTKRH
jgi:hypothetical protein